jgi:LemA protein
MNSKSEAAKGQWANVEAAYQRRADLIPNLVNTVKGYAKFEQETLEGVMAARSKATSITIDPSKLDEASIKRFQESQGAITGALARLLAVSERYPELKANQNFLELQSQLEGTENRINVERRRYNELVQEYNTTIKSFPNVMFSGMFGFTQMGYFKADPETQKAPKVSF